MRKILLVLGLLLVSGCATTGRRLQGSTDDPGLTEALERCRVALADTEIGLGVKFPTTVIIDPELPHKHLDARRGMSIYPGTIILVDANWRGDNALCHEIIHLSLPAEAGLGHPQWTERGFYAAIERAR